MNRAILITIIILALIIAGIIVFLSLYGQRQVPTKSFDCSEDVYNCDDFSTQQGAQKAFDFCDHEGAGDVHRLDNDGDGVVCESLP